MYGPKVRLVESWAVLGTALVTDTFCFFLAAETGSGDATTDGGLGSGSGAITAAVLPPPSVAAARTLRTLFFDARCDGTRACSSTSTCTGCSCVACCVSGFFSGTETGSVTVTTRFKVGSGTDSSSPSCSFLNDVTPTLVRGFHDDVKGKGSSSVPFGPGRAVVVAFGFPLVCAAVLAGGPQART